MLNNNWLICIVIAGSVFLLSAGCNKQKADSVKPNIVLIYADDMGYGDVQILNPDSKIPTPNINSLASEGISFTNAHSPAAVCTPSRYSLLTGRYSWRSEMKKGVKWVWDRPLLQKDEFTIGRMLKNEGYSTALIGKWHLGWDWPTTDGKPATTQNKGQNVDYDQPIKNGPITRGFDYYFGSDVPSFPPHAFIENDQLIVKPTEWMRPGNAGIPGAMASGWRYEDLQTSLADKAIQYIENQTSDNPEKPFFLFFSSSAPHTPIAPGDDFAGRTEAGRYGDFVHELDHHVGRIRSTVDNLNISDNTLIIFTSDNGPVNMDGMNYTGKVGSLLEYGHDSTGGLRGIKSDAWEGGHRVPLIVKWPSYIKPNSTSDELISQVDFMATFAGLLDINLPGDAAEDSYNMWPVLTGQSENNIREALVTQSGNGVLAIQKGRWKLILSSGGGGKWTKPRGELPRRVSGGSGSYWENVQLYDLENDLKETDNKASEHPETVKELMRLLKDYIREGRSTPGEPLKEGEAKLWTEVEWIKDLE